MITIQLVALTWLCCGAFQISEGFQLSTIGRNLFQKKNQMGIASPRRRPSSQLASAINNVDWGRKTVLQLQKELRLRDLSDKGSKTVLIQRLEALNTVKDSHHNQRDNVKTNTNTNGPSSESSYAGSGASSYATSSSAGSKSAPDAAFKTAKSLAQNQTMVDMDSDEARRIENYLKKVKQQQKTRQRPPQRKPRPTQQQQQQQQQQQRSPPQQRPPQRRPQSTVQSPSYSSPGQQLRADPFMNGQSLMQPNPSPPSQRPRRKETIIDVTSTATYASRPSPPPPASSRASSPQRSEDDIYDSAASASSQQATWGRNSFQPAPRSPPTSPSQPPKPSEQTVTATSYTSEPPPKKWSGTKKESRAFLSIDKDDFLMPYDAAVEMNSVGASAAKENLSEIKSNADVLPDLDKGSAKSTLDKGAIEVSTVEGNGNKGGVNGINGVNGADEMPLIRVNEMNSNGADEALVNEINYMNDAEEISVKGPTVSVDRRKSEVHDASKEVFFLDKESEEARINGVAVDEGLWTRDEPYPFEVLGVEAGASMSEIKSAYRKKAMELSLESNADDSEETAERLRQVVEAFQVLSGGYKKGKYEEEYQMLQRLQRRQEKEQVVETDDDETSDMSSLEDLLPHTLYEQLSLRFNSTELSLLPLQKECYKAIVGQEDVVLNAPAESGKTLGYLLPLLAKLPNPRNASDTSEEMMNLNLKRGRRKKRNRRNKLAAEVEELSRPCKPTLLCIAPSKEVALEIGKLFSQYHGGKGDAVATVFEGVPVKKQKNLLQKSSLQIVVGTPARLLKYILMGVLDPAEIKTIVVDEADDMLDHLGVIEDIFVSIQTDNYQKVVTSVEMSSALLEFCEENMGLTKKSSNFITLTDEKEELTVESEEEAEDKTCDEVDMDIATDCSVQNDVDDDDIITVEIEDVQVSEVPLKLNTAVLATMDHWHTATRSADRPILSLDIVASMSPAPKVVVIFVPSDENVESVAQQLEIFHKTRVRTLTEASSNDSRKETLGSIRAHSKCGANEAMILVTSDVAAEAADLPPADLILQYGIPRQPSNSNLYDANVYMTRIQRACGENKDAEAMLLYDYEEEGRLLPGLQTEMEVDCDIVLKPRALPAPQHTLEASYLYTKSYCESLECMPLVVESFEKQLKAELTGLADMDREDELFHRLAIAMAALSNQTKLSEERP
ncbi:MAG: hypothetical protein SGBAC_008757 [Bacillariaceae sp.]